MITLILNTALFPEATVWVSLEPSQVPSQPVVIPSTSYSVLAENFSILIEGVLFNKTWVGFSTGQTLILEVLPLAVTFATLV